MATRKATKSAKQAPTALLQSGQRVLVIRGGTMVLINAPPAYESMARLVTPAKPSPDPVDTIHVFVDGPADLPSAMAVAGTYRGQQTRLVVLFRHHDRMSASRSAIEEAMDGFGFRASTLISMGDSDWGAVSFRKKVAASSRGADERKK